MQKCVILILKIYHLMKKFDAIFCLDVLEHIFDPQNVVKSIFNTLSENGRFAVCVPNVLNLANRIRFLLGDFVDYMDSSHKDKNRIIFRTY